MVGTRAQHAAQGQSMSFKDHFSQQATAYRRYRPGYPESLIDFVASRAPDRGLAVDCATGSGQAAVELARHFASVIAVDGSRRQLAAAQAHPRVHYVAALAERLPLRDRCVSLVVAAQAAHWFDLGRFHAECRRVLLPEGAVALWTYEKFRVDEAADAIVDRFYTEVVGKDWPAERRYVEQRYRTLPFPWREETVPSMVLETDWDLDQVMGYLATWSAVQRFRKRVGRDPLPALRAQLDAVWPAGRVRQVLWPIHLRLGRV
jgi:SAM-dependent methyltransferase